MVGRIDDMKDRYGRDLRVVRRLAPDGSYQIDRREDARERAGAAAFGWVQDGVVLIECAVAKMLFTQFALS